MLCTTEIRRGTDGGVLVPGARRALGDQRPSRRRGEFQVLSSCLAYVSAVCTSVVPLASPSLCTLICSGVAEVVRTFFVVFLCRMSVCFRREKVLTTYERDANLARRALCASCGPMYLYLVLSIYHLSPFPFKVVCPQPVLVFPCPYIVASQGSIGVSHALWDSRRERVGAQGQFPRLCIDAASLFKPLLRLITFLPPRISRRLLLWGTDLRHDGQREGSPLRRRSDRGGGGQHQRRHRGQAQRWEVSAGAFVWERLRLLLPLYNRY